MLARSVLLCVLGAIYVSAATTGTTDKRRSDRGRRRSTFLDIVNEKPSREGSYKSPVLPAELPIKLAGHGGVNLPVLVLPVPVPFYTKSDSCETKQDKNEEVSHPPPPFIPPPYIASRHPTYDSGEPPTDTQSTPQRPTEPGSNKHQNYYQYPVVINLDPPQEPIRVKPQRKPTQTYIPPYEKPVIYERIGGSNEPSGPEIQSDYNDQSIVPQPGSDYRNEYVGYDTGFGPQPPYIPEDPNIRAESHIDYIPYSGERGHIFATTDELIQSYWRESPTEPWLPAVMPSGRQFPARLPAPAPDAAEPTVPAPAPPRPRFARSLRMLIDLTVPRSDYTEVYDLVWHADSNTVRTVVEDGNTVFYRVPRLDGGVQFLKMQEDRLSGTAVRRCTVSPLLPASPADSSYPGLPDLSLFYFVGYTSAEGRPQVEHWQHVVVGAPGEGGAARGEALNYTHDFYLYRDGWDAVPLRYTVVAHSSVLGPASDTYTHRYRLLPTPTTPIIPDLSECHVVEEMKEEDMRQQGVSGNILTKLTSSEKDLIHGLGDLKEDKHWQKTLRNISEAVPSTIRKFNPGEELKDEDKHQEQQEGDKGDIISKIASVARDFFHPIGEFLGSTKPAKYDTIFQDYKDKFKRKYRDEGEEAVRKAQLIKTHRFVDAANRIASNFKAGINSRADRTQDEKDLSSTGVPLAGAALKKEYAAEFGLKDALGIVKKDKQRWESFDWREHGFKKSGVFHQGETCNSCWACALAGSVEGALLRKTGKWTQLSPQSMVDCGNPYTNGCKESEPADAAEYVKKNGLSAWNVYTYTKKVGSCRMEPTITRISEYRSVIRHETALKVAIRNYAPTIVIIPAKSNGFDTYDGTGTLDDERCKNSPGSKHAVLAIGWGMQGSDEYFIIKNSWGKEWGDDGYAKIKSGQCDILNNAAYVKVKKEDIEDMSLKESYKDSYTDEELRTFFPTID